MKMEPMQWCAKSQSCSSVAVWREGPVFRRCSFLATRNQREALFRKLKGSSLFLLATLKLYPHRSIDALWTLQPLVRMGRIRCSSCRLCHLRKSWLSSRAAEHRDRSLFETMDGNWTACSQWCALVRHHDSQSTGLACPIHVPPNPTHGPSSQVYQSVMVSL